MIKVRVPGTTSNLGSGFDCLGLALTIYGEFGFEETESGLSFTGVDPQYQNEDNLAIVSYRKVKEEAGFGRKYGLKLSIKSDIPISRGLGSSGSLIAAGAVAANVSCGNALSPEELLDIAAGIEGHPDNVAPALLGGFTVALKDEGRFFARRCLIHEKLKFCALVPDFEVSTRKAREALPSAVPFSNAVFNLSRAAMMVPAMASGDLKLIALAMKDTLHQKYRAPLIHQFEQVRSACLASGAAAVFISGSGPTVMCIYENDSFPCTMESELSAMHDRWKAIALKPDMHGATVLEE
ncbi:MAG: homoserine kinase [Sphaerochaetaceae bacterium]|nr:homoserine kinase [Sphaerochaetaceae bacterium]